MQQQLNPQSPSTEAPAAPAPRAKVGVMPLFSSWIYQCRDGPVHLNARLEELTARLRQDARNNVKRTNAGGWHYAFDVFELKEPVIDEFRDQMELHVRTFLNHFRSEA